MSTEVEPPTPRDRRADAMRRLQVGGTGLILVALLVGLSTLLTSESREAADAASTSAATTEGAAGSSTAEDPLTDLGVEPASAEQPAAVPVPPKVETPAPAAPLVPDLQPDPQLDGAPPRR